MFVDFRDQPPPPPWRPARPDPPRLTGRQQRVLGWMIGLNLVMLVLGPFAGATVIDAAVALFGR